MYLLPKSSNVGLTTSSNLSKLLMDEGDVKKVNIFQFVKINKLHSLYNEGDGWEKLIDQVVHVGAIKITNQRLVGSQQSAIK